MKNGISFLILTIFWLFSPLAIAVQNPIEKCPRALTLKLIEADPELAHIFDLFLANMEPVLVNVPGSSLADKVAKLVPSAADLVPKEVVGVITEIYETPDRNSLLARLTEYNVGEDPYVELEYRDQDPTRIHRQRLPIHRLTRGFFIKEKKDENALQAIVNSISKATQGEATSAFLFVDLNFLGKVNYFQGGFQDGDRYIQAFGEAVQAVFSQSLRIGPATNLQNENRKVSFSQDLLFAIGGDEFIVVLRNVTPHQTKQIADRLQLAFRNNPTVKQIFAAQAASSKMATVNELLDFSRMTPSVTIGASMIHRGSCFTDVWQRAQAAYILSKRNFNEARGLDATKYGGRKAAEKDSSVNLDALPETALPE